MERQVETTVKRQARLRGLSAAVILASLAVASARWAAADQAEPRVLRTLEGTVVALGESQAEGGLTVLSLRVDADDPAGEILLAPEQILLEVGFEVQVGDRIKARVFAERDSQRLLAQRVMNLSRKQILRLRTLQREPLWDRAGTWQGVQQGVGRHRTHRRRPHRVAPRRPQSRPPPALGRWQ